MQKLERPAKPYQRPAPNFTQPVDPVTLSELERKARWFDAIMAHAPLNIYFKDRDGRFLAVNKQFEKSFGVRAEDLVGSADRPFLENDIQHVASEHDREVLRRGVSVERHEVIDATVYRVLKCPLEGADGVVDTIIGFDVDVTALHNAHEVAQQRKMEAMGKLLSSVSHDFNNLLANIVAAFRLLAKSDLGQRERDVVELGVAATDRATALVGSLLSFARQRPAEQVDIDLAARVRDALPLIEQTVGGGITVETRIEADLPRVKGDRNELDMAILNLTTNARDAMPMGGTLRILVDRITAPGTQLPGRGRQQVALTVADTGAGIAPDVLEHVFEPFYSTKPDGKGTGLGLSQVYGFARRSGGRATIQSEAGVGTRVSILLPPVNAVT